MTISTFGRGPGQWHIAQLSNGDLTAVFYCPKCGKGMDLFNHKIDDFGVVTPSVVEINIKEAKQGECGTFHDSITLEGWTPAPQGDL